MRRDNRNIEFSGSSFAVILDTFYDRRNGFLFQTNPLGALYDAQVTDERNTNSDWNTIWYVKSGRFAEGWTVEMAIPFKSLRYRAGTAQIWGVNFQRIIKWKNERSYLTPMPAAFNRDAIKKLSVAAALVGVEPPAKSMNLEIKPYVIGSSSTNLAADVPFENRGDADVGFDVKYGVTKSLVADVTYNTDFAQVEDDESQVNLTRFGLFFPEKREFFLEGQGIFNFGGRQSGRRGGFGGGGQSDTPNLFFSRRIGLSGSSKVPILTGGRLTGRAGPYSLGLLNISTRSRGRCPERQSGQQSAQPEREHSRRALRRGDSGDPCRAGATDRLKLKARHLEAYRLQIGDQLFALHVIEFDERWPQPIPLRVGTVMRDDRLESRDQRKLLNRPPHLI